jgi:tubulin monoglycylase TTLL15
MISADKNVAVNGIICGSLQCTETCAPEECRLCRPCLSPFDLYDLHRSYREHVNRGDTKRLFPVSIVSFRMFNKFFSEIYEFYF